jgi:DNA invertase Pin-like site-specific DNA recombinase
MSMAQPKIYSYVRFSSERQLNGDSLKRQNELIDRYTKREGYVLDSEFRYVDVGISAFRGENLKEGKLSLFLNAIQEQRVSPGSILLIESLDRLTRITPTEALTMFLNIINAGVKIITLSDGVEHSKDKPEPERFTNLLISVTTLCRAHEESLMKSKRLKAAWVRKREDIKRKPYSKRIPRWLQLTDDKLSATVIESKATLVRRMFELCLAGNHAEGIARIFRKENAPMVGGGTKWRHSYVAQTLRNVAVTGEFTPHRMENGKRVPALSKPISGYYPQIVSKGDFDRVQFIMDSRTKNKGGRVGTDGANLFKKIIFCGYCGAPVHVNYKGRHRDGRSRKTLVCRNAKDEGGCLYVGWLYSEFEDAFLSSARELHVLLKDKFQGSGLREEIQQHTGRLTTIEKQLNRFQEMLEMDDEGAVQPKLVLRRIRELEAEQADVANKKETAEQKLTAGLDGPEPLVNLEKLTKKLEDPGARKLIADLISQLFERIDMFAAGSKLDFARLKRMHKSRVRERGKNDSSVSVYIRDHFNRRKVRFFRPVLAIPGVGGRLSFSSDGKPMPEARLDLVEDLPDDAEFVGVEK